MYSPEIIIVPVPNVEKGASTMQVINITTWTYQSVGKTIFKLLLKELGGIHLAEDSNYGGILV
jgi:hypothetical protein